MWLFAYTFLALSTTCSVILTGAGLFIPEISKHRQVAQLVMLYAKVNSWRGWVWNKLVVLKRLLMTVICVERTQKKIL